MSAGTTHRGALVALLALLGPACGSPDPTLPGDTEWRSEHFVYRTRAGDRTVCSGVLDTLERHFSVMQGYLGFAWPAGRIVEYFKYPNEQDFQGNEWCTVGTNGCQRGNRVFAVDPLHEHELVHAYLEPLGLPPPILLEGVAQALSCSGFASQAEAEPPATWQVSDRADAYQPGQWLVAYLLRAYGPELFLDLYGSVPSEASAEDLASIFESIYGTSLDQVWSAATSVQSPESGCVFVWECEGEPAGFSDSFALSESCDQGDRYRTLSLEAPSVLDFSVQPNFGYVRSCGDTFPAPYADRVEGLAVNGRTLVELEPGRYLLNSDTATTLALRELSPSPLSEDCDAADVALFEDFPAGRRFLLARREAPRYFRFATESEADVWVWPEEETDEVAVCRACDGESCLPAVDEAYRGGPSFSLRVAETPQASGFSDFTLQALAIAD